MSDRGNIRDAGLRMLGSLADVKTVTPSDDDDLPDGPCRAFMVTVSGAVKVTMVSGETVVLPASLVTAGRELPYRVLRFWENGTDATGILAGY